jgi:hypothetical protein
LEKLTPSSYIGIAPALALDPKTSGQKISQQVVDTFLRSLQAELDPKEYDRLVKVLPSYFVPSPDNSPKRRAEQANPLNFRPYQ